jgi:hypothetical protein
MSIAGVTDSAASKIASAAIWWVSVWSCAMATTPTDMPVVASISVRTRWSASPSRAETPCSAAARIACCAARLIHSSYGETAEVISVASRRSTRRRAS